MTSNVYSSEFVAYLLDMFWAQTQKKIILLHFLPYLIFVIVCVLYMYDTLSRKELGFKNDTPQEEKVYNKTTGSLTLLLLANVIRAEILQLKGTGLSTYMKSFYNYVDIVSIVLTLFLTSSTMLEVELLPIETLRMLAAILTFFLLLKMYDWLRLFEDTSFFVQLVQRTLSRRRTRTMRASRNSLLTWRKEEPT